MNEKDWDKMVKLVRGLGQMLGDLSNKNWEMMQIIHDDLDVISTKIDFVFEAIQLEDSQ